MAKLYLDRKNAGLALLPLLEHWRPAHPLLLALPKGGVPVGAAIAQARSIPMDVFVVKKMATPNHPEITMGALASGGTMVWNPEVLSKFKLPEKLTLPILEKARLSLQEEEASYRSLRPKLSVQGKDILLVDDGLASGSTMKAAVLALGNQDIGSLTVAVPVSSEEGRDAILPLVREMICAHCPDDFQNVNRWYQEYAPVTEAEVETLLKSLAR